MARCQVCLKSGQSGNNVSHSKRRTRTRWHANVQRATITDSGVRRKVSICTRCLRSHYQVISKG
ncbi:MAG: 50S ribosomal protein L28 [Chloroflexota bacterium]|nr:50S ribosomal protein L28 [Chloroflexota bacterium]